MNEILEHKRNYDADKKLADRQCLEKMLQTSVALLDREITFHTILGGGREPRLI